MNRTNHHGAAVALLLWGYGVLPAFGQFDTTGTASVSVTIGAEASLSVTTSSVTLVSGALFADFTGTTDYSYKLRTSQSGGSGSITLEITSDFSPAGGPSVATPPSSGDVLAYTCTVTSPGTSCSGLQTSSTATATSVATFGADAHSAAAGNPGSVSWALTNDPLYKTGSYSATATLTISAT